MLAQVGDLATATHEQLEQAFTSLYRVQGSSLRKALSFFTHMAQEGDIALAAFIHTAHHQGPRRTHQPTHAAATSTQLARFHNGGYALLICMGGPFTLEVPERQFLFGLVDRFQEYEQGRGTTIHEKKHGQAQEMTKENGSP